MDRTMRELVRDVEKCAIEKREPPVFLPKISGKGERHCLSCVIDVHNGIEHILINSFFFIFELNFLPFKVLCLCVCFFQRSATR
jgi:hypothetical protein